MSYHYAFGEQRRLVLGSSHARSRLDVPISTTLWERVAALSLVEQPRLLTVLQFALQQAMDAWEEAVQETDASPVEEREA